jgi:3-hydroxy-9,10-secoandrosta-1,3,5(10)-triene-9,17-dione monooxygenase
LGFETIVRVGAELATACSSTGWIYGVFAGHNWILSLFPEAAQKEILTDPLTLTASVLRCGAKVTPVEGGYRLTNALGRFCSGVDHADWIILGISIERSSAPAEARLCLVPAAEVEVIDDWHTLGMRGTGSRSIRIADTFVPEYRTCVLADLMRGAAPGTKSHPDCAALRVPFAIGAAFCLAGAPLGMARSAVEFMCQTAANRLRNVPPGQLAEKGPLFARIASASADVDASVALILSDCTFVDGLCEPQQMDLVQRARLRRDLAYAVRTCRHAATSLLEGAGGAAIYDADPLQRVWRDLNSAGAHVAFSWDDTVSDFARAALKLPAGASVRV